MNYIHRKEMASRVKLILDNAKQVKMELVDSPPVLKLVEENASKIFDLLDEEEKFELSTKKKRNIAHIGDSLLVVRSLVYILVNTRIITNHIGFEQIFNYTKLIEHLLDEEDEK